MEFSRVGEATKDSGFISQMDQTDEDYQRSTAKEGVEHMLTPRGHPKDAPERTFFPFTTSEYAAARNLQTSIRTCWVKLFHSFASFRSDISFFHQLLSIAFLWSRSETTS